MNRLMEIQRLRARRAQCDRLGKRHAALLIEAQIRHLMLRELRHEERTADAWQDWPSEAYGDQPLPALRPITEEVRMPNMALWDEWKKNA